MYACRTRQKNLHNIKTPADTERDAIAVTLRMRQPTCPDSRFLLVRSSRSLVVAGSHYREEAGPGEQVFVCRLPPIRRLFFAKARLKSVDERVALVRDTGLVAGSPSSSGPFSSRWSEHRVSDHYFERQHGNPAGEFQLGASGSYSAGNRYGRT